MEESSFISKEDSLKRNCTSEAVESILKEFDTITLESVEFYKEGTYEEEV